VRISSEGLEFIKQFEKFVAFIYDDFNPRKEWDGSPPRGTLTIGYGHTKAAADPIRMVKGLRVTQQQATDILINDLAPAQDVVNSLVRVTLRQHQFDALVSFKFNTGRLAGTGLLNKINARNFDAVPSEFMKWVRSKGQVLLGLKRRRQGEIDLWNKP